MSVDTADAVVIGAGPNGLIAGALLARKGWDVTVLEHADEPGGAVRSMELTEPGYIHDTFSAFYGLLRSTPVFEKFDLHRRVDWADFTMPMGAAISPEQSAVIHTDEDLTLAAMAKMDPADGEAYRELLAWWDGVGRHFYAMTIAPVGAIRPALRFARASGIRRMLENVRMLIAPVDEVLRDRFSSEMAQVLIASGISHADISPEAAGSTPMTLILAMLAQRHGFPVPVGGAQKLADAMAACVTEEGGTVRCGDAVTKVIVERGRAWGVETLGGGVVRARHAVLADTGPLALCRDLVGEHYFPSRYLDGLRSFRYGTGVYKLDIALSGITPWLDEQLRETGVVHLTGTLDDMARANFEARHGVVPSRPMLIIGQQSVADPTRAPAGGHTLWIETHVPPEPATDAVRGSVGGWVGASDVFRDRIIDLIEQHAPGFRERIVGMAVHTPQQLEARNPNLVGGDISGGSGALHQQLVFRPVSGWFRYRTPVKHLYLCSASTHPGGGVHGMCGYNAARRALRDARTPGGIARTAGGARRRPS